MRVKLFNLNCWLLPSPFSIDNKKRLANIISFIKKQNPDIITLQEVWMKKYVKKIKRELPQYKFFSYSSKLYNKSGLLFGIKWKPLFGYQKIFPITNLHSKREKIGSKGYQLFEVSPGVFVMNTQLYAPEKSYQMKITVSHFREIEKASSGKRVILSGDLNLEEYEFSKINKTFYYKSPLNFTIAKKNPYCHSRFNKLNDANKIIDYVVSNEKNIPVESKVYNPVTFSDHYSLKGTFEI